MQINPVQQASEGDLTYWRNRVLSLEVLVCELLAKNQRMRFTLDGITQERLEANSLFYSLDSRSPWPVRCADSDV
jgi:hypothetical protein